MKSITLPPHGLLQRGKKIKVTVSSPTLGPVSYPIESPARAEAWHKLFQLLPRVPRFCSYHILMSSVIYY